MPDLLPCSRCRADVDARERHTTVVRQTERYGRWSGPHVLDAVVLAVLCPACEPLVTVEMVPRPVQLVCPVDGCGHTEVVAGGVDPEPVLMEHAKRHSLRDLAHALAQMTTWAPVGESAPEPTPAEANADA